MWFNQHSQGKSLVSWTRHVTQWSLRCLGSAQFSNVPGKPSRGGCLRGLGFSVQSGNPWAHHFCYEIIYSQGDHSSDLLILMTIIWCQHHPLGELRSNFDSNSRMLALWGKGAHLPTDWFFPPFCGFGSHHWWSDLLGDCCHLRQLLKNWTNWESQWFWIDVIFRWLCFSKYPNFLGESIRLNRETWEKVLAAGLSWGVTCDLSVVGCGQRLYLPDPQRCCLLHPQWTELPSAPKCFPFPRMEDLWTWGWVDGPGPQLDKVIGISVAGKEYCIHHGTIFICLVLQRLIYEETLEMLSAMRKGICRVLK